MNAGRGSYSPIVYWRKIKHLIEDVGLKFNEVVAYIDISDPQNELAYKLSKDNNIEKAVDQKLSANKVKINQQKLDTENTKTNFTFLLLKTI